ncbi:TetR/AcrR family transcriptional regulator [Amycolatopsis nalaikhensis]|uniref:TetR/AcrR family transcriptional regulator n=1 Tax=Amycolatopsis nalaikhensis TaxID=715472 RepID=A0ABY8XKF3_9PSEU|nr:TetR/AcrR family transcriptional regulator [Amycolatopsis sp. 2-2]WIV56120.1 TetR/AcrR family transcriptional regulator [Amycolatopsis sp. 2-2]
MAVTQNTAESGRRDAVLESALLTFARHGYRKTSMAEVAHAARISRPGLYFLFASKEDLFRAAVTRALEQDLAAAERILADPGPPLRERLLGAFDRWAGRYVGPMSRDVPSVIEQNPDLLGSITRTAPERFEELVVTAVGGPAAAGVAQTLISASVGLKYQVGTREEYLARMATAIGLLVP